MELLASPQLPWLWREAQSSSMAPGPLHIPPSLLQIREFLLTQQKLDWFALKKKKKRQLLTSAFASCVPGENKSRKQRGRVGEAGELPGIQLPLLAKVWAVKALWSSRFPWKPLKKITRKLHCYPRNLIPSLNCKNMNLSLIIKDCLLLAVGPKLAMN